MKSLLKAWKKRKLTTIGKILIIKSLILPKFTFLATSCIVPNKYIKEIESCCFKYIWEGKNDKVKRNTLIGEYQKGGLKMVDFDSYFTSLKASWVSKFNSTTMPNWKIIPTKYFNNLGKNYLVFNMNLDNVKSLKEFENIPDFYLQVISSWVKTGGGFTKFKDNFSNIRKQIIWGNRYVKHCNKSLFFQNWVASGLIYINDILDREGKLSEVFILEKLSNKSNWIAEFTILKSSIPKEWQQVLIKENSLKSKISINKDNLRWGNKQIQAQDIFNKILYNSLVDQKYTQPIGINILDKKFKAR